MTDDLVKRLRNLVGQYIGDADIDDELQGAADRIEKLEAALQKIDRSECLHPHDIVEIARKVLVEGKNGQ